MSIQHEDVTSIHRFAYVSNSDPGTVGAYKAWVDTTTTPNVLKIRNAGNTAWVTVGESTTASNVGSGSGDVFKQRSANEFQFRKLKMNGGITITTFGNDVLFTVDTSYLEDAGFLQSTAEGFWADQGYIAAQRVVPSGSIAQGTNEWYFYFGADIFPATTTGSPIWPIAGFATLTSNTNNFDNAFVPSRTWFFQSDAARNFTGIVSQAQYEEHTFINNGTFNITLKHEDSNSSAENRFSCPNSVDIVLVPGQAADFIYDPALLTGRWRVWEKPGRNPRRLADYLSDVAATDTPASLITKSIAASTLSVNGDRIDFLFSGTFAANANSKFVYIKFAGTTLFSDEWNDSGGGWEISGSIIRETSTTVKCSVKANHQSDVSVAYARVTGLTLSSANDLVLYGNGDSNSDWTSKFGWIDWKPSA